MTDLDTLGCVIDAVGSLRIAIEAQLCTQQSGSRLRVLGGNLVNTAKPIGVVDGVDFHYTGEVRRIDRKAIARHLDEQTVVLSSIGYSPTGEAATSPAKTLPPAWRWR